MLRCAVPPDCSSEVHLTRKCELAVVAVSPASPQPHGPRIAILWPGLRHSIGKARSWSTYAPPTRGSHDTAKAATSLRRIDAASAAGCGGRSICSNCGSRWLTGTGDARRGGSPRPLMHLSPNRIGGRSHGAKPTAQRRTQEPGSAVTGIAARRHDQCRHRAVGLNRTILPPQRQRPASRLLMKPAGRRSTSWWITPWSGVQGGAPR